VQLGTQLSKVDTALAAGFLLYHGKCWQRRRNRLLKVVSNGTGGGGVSGISRSALISSTFPQIQKKILKGPGPLKNKKRF
jgi:hypothetical protein